MKVKLVDPNDKLIDFIEILDPVHKSVVNGEDILEFETTYPVTKNNRIFYKRNDEWYEFIISGYTKIHTTNSIIYKVSAENSFYETLGDYIEDLPLYKTSLYQAVKKVLRNSRWLPGFIETIDDRDTHVFHTSVKEAMHKNVLDVWGCEMKTRIILNMDGSISRYLDVKRMIGNDTGRRFVYNRNVYYIEKEVSREHIVTALYGYGKSIGVDDGFGQRVNIKSVTNGKGYIEDPIAKNLYGRSDGKGGKDNVYGYVCFDNLDKPAEILEATKKELKKLSEPKITYTINIDDFSNYHSDTIFEKIRLGDKIVVIDKEEKLRINMRVLEYVDYLNNTQSNQITLGNYKVNYIAKQIQQEKTLERIKDKETVYDKSDLFLNGLIDELNNQINSSGGYVYISNDGKGLITYDRPIDQNPTKAIQIKGGSFRIANRRKPNGDWDWRTFGTGDGFVADLIVAGMLKGGKVKFDLSNGTLMIGDENNKSLHWNGSKLFIKGDGVDLTSNNEYTGFKTQIIQDANSIRMTAQNAKSTAEQALTADAYTRTIANRADGNASTAIQKANSIEFQFQNYSPDKVKYGTTYALTPSECYIAYNGQRKFQVSTYSGDVSIEGSFTSPHLVANQSGMSIKGSYGSTLLRPSDDRLEVYGLRANNNVTFLGNLIMQGNSILNGGLAITFAYGTTYPIEMRQGVECFSGLYVHGAKNAVVDTDEGMVAVSCYEMADTYFGDIGTGVINNDGFCMISLDDTFRKTVNTEVEYLVFLTKEGRGDVWISEKSQSYFTVKGTKGLKFAYEIKAKRINYETSRLERVENKINDIAKQEEKELIDSLSQVDTEELLRKESVEYEENHRSNVN